MASSKWKVMVDDIESQIESGRLKPGDKLPSTSQLCEKYSVSTIVVRNAMLHLKAKGRVTGVPGVATFVAEDPT